MTVDISHSKRDQVGARAACRRDRRPAHKRFWRDEDGSLIIFSLFMFVLMLMIGGLAVDVMRFENVRTKMQNTLDRAVLAAADLDQTVDPTAVVDDYFAKAGMDILDYSVNVSQTNVQNVLTSRSVSATTSLDMGTLFMGLMGQNQLPVPAGSVAAETINDVEISLILDVSGSMGWNNKLENMQDAAKDFIDQVFATAQPGRMSVSIVPYSTQVSAGETLLGQFNATNEHTYSSCVDFDGADFATTAISSTTPLQRAGHFDPWTWWSNGQAPQRFVCRTEADFSIQAWSDDTTALKDQIDGFTAQGNTSIDIAVKWGSALLDPAAQGVLNGMVGAGEVNPAFTGRPYNFNRPDTLKFIVVMTDGINTTQYYLNNGYRSGPSPVFRDQVSGGYSTQDQEILDADGDGVAQEEYWSTTDREWISAPYGGGGAVQLTWPQVWAEMNLSWNAYNNKYAQYWNNSDYWDEYYAPRSSVNAATKDTRLSTICSAAKNQNVTIFAIGFEVSDYSAGVMADCASTVNHFYRVTGQDISYAFSSIANQINQLKLTQ